MTEQWQELKDTIIELRDNDGTGTQQEACKFLANCMDILEKQMQEPCEMTAEEYRQRMIQVFHNADTDGLIAICVRPTEKEFEHLEWLLKNHYKQKPKTGHWIPVSEKLPEEGKEMLTCSNGGFIEIQSLEDSCADIYWENQKGDWTNIDEVIAWMPLPEPYKPQVESEV